MQTLEQFGQTIKAKYPQYNDIGDAELGQKMLAKYPQYHDMVQVTPSDSLQGKNQQSQQSKSGVFKNILDVNNQTGIIPDSWQFTPTDVGNRTDAGVIGDTLKNQAKSVANLGIGVAKFLDPIANAKKIGGAISGAVGYNNQASETQTAQQGVKDYIPRLQEAIAKNKAIGRDTSNLERLLKEAGGQPVSNPALDVAKELPNALYQNVASDAIKKGIGGDAYGAVQSIAQDPQQLTPYFLALKKPIESKLPAVDKAISKVADPFIKPFAGDINAGGTSGMLNPVPMLKDVAAKATPDVFTKDVSTLRSEKITQGFQELNSRLQTANKAYSANTKTYATPDGVSKTVTPTDTFAKYNITPEIKNGSILMGDYKTGDGALGKIKEQVSSLDGDINTHLVDTGKQFEVNQLRNEAISKAKADPELKQAGLVQSTVNKLNARFDDYLSSYGDKIDIQEVNNIRKVANKDWSPETMDASRIVGDMGRDAVYNSTPDLVVKKLLQEQGDLLAAKKYAEAVNGKKVTGGRLGNYAMRTAGAIIGTSLHSAPVIGPLIGMVGGEYLSRALQQSQFKSLGAEFKSLFQREPLRSNNIDPTQSANIMPKSAAIEKGITNKQTIVPQKLEPNKPLNPNSLIKVNDYASQFPKYITPDQVSSAMKILEGLKQKGKTIDMKALISVVKKVVPMSDIGEVTGGMRKVNVNSQPPIEAIGKSFQEIRRESLKIEQQGMDQNSAAMESSIQGLDYSHWTPTAAKAYTKFKQIFNAWKDNPEDFGSLMKTEAGKKLRIQIEDVSKELNVDSNEVFNIFQDRILRENSKVSVKVKRK